MKRRILLGRQTLNEASESQQRDWLAAHAEQVLREIGIGSGQVVLDFGCGAGPYVLPAARLVGEAGKVYALDKSAEFLQQVSGKAAEQGLGNIEIIHSSGEMEVALPDGTCHAMLLYDVLHIIDDWPKLFGEAFRLLQAGGLLSIFPMHLDQEKVKRQVEEVGFVGEGQVYAILNFRKPTG